MGMLPFCIRGQAYSRPFLLHSKTGPMKARTIGKRIPQAATPKKEAAFQAKKRRRHELLQGSPSMEEIQLLSHSVGHEIHSTAENSNNSFYNCQQKTAGSGVFFSPFNRDGSPDFSSCAIADCMVDYRLYPVVPIVRKIITILGC